MVVIESINENEHDKNVQFGHEYPNLDQKFKNGIILFDLSSMKDSGIKSLTIGIDFFENELTGNFSTFAGFIGIPIYRVNILYWNTDVYERCSRIFHWGEDDYVGHWNNGWRNDTFLLKQLDASIKHENSLKSHQINIQESDEFFMVLKWMNEDLVLLKPNEDAFQRIVHEYHSMHYVGRMKSYTQNEVWGKLSSLITIETIKRIRPIHSQWIQSGLLKSERKYIHKYYKQNSKAQYEIENRESLAYFTNIDLFVRSAMLSPSEVTMINFDKSVIVKSLIRDAYKGKSKELLGEFQCCFVLFILGHCYDALEQWERRLVILCQCNSLLCDETMNEFWNSFLSILDIQLSVIPLEFLTEDPNNTIFESLRQLLDLIDIAPKSLAKLMIKFKKDYEEKFGVSLELREDDEFAPTVCYD